MMETVDSEFVTNHANTLFFSLGNQLNLYSRIFPPSSHSFPHFKKNITPSHTHPLLLTPTLNNHFSYFENFYNLRNCVYE